MIQPLPESLAFSCTTSLTHLCSMLQPLWPCSLLPQNLLTCCSFFLDHSSTPPPHTKLAPVFPQYKLKLYLLKSAFVNPPCLSFLAIITDNFTFASIIIVSQQCLSSLLDSSSTRLWIPSVVANHYYHSPRQENVIGAQ